jgi:hypothetical protein
VFVQTNGTATISSVTDNGSGGSSTYASIFNGACNTPGGYNCGLFYTCNTKASVTTVTANYSVSDAGSIIVAEYSGMATSSCNDQASTGATGSGTIQTAGSITTTQAAELLIGAFLADGSTVFATQGSYLAVKSQNCSACASEIGMTDQIVAATNTYSATATTAPTSVTWNGHTASFKAAASATGPCLGFKGKYGVLGKTGFKCS